MKVLITHKNKIKAKVSVTYDDLWNGEVTLAHVIYPFLKKYRQNFDDPKGHHCYPAVFAADPTKPKGHDNQDRYDEWLQCLDKMTYSFEWIAKHGSWDGPAEKEFFKEYDKMLKLHKKELNKLAQEDKIRFKNTPKPCALESLKLNRELEIMRPVHERFHKQFEEHHQKIQAGIDLFAKYFGSFWL